MQIRDFVDLALGMLDTAERAEGAAEKAKWADQPKLDGLATRTAQYAQAYAMLAVADELRRIREVFERLEATL